MAQENRHISIDRRFPWSFLGFLTGVAFGVFGIYTVFFYAKAPDLRAEIQSAAPVFSLRENIQDLDIMFKGQNIRATRKALSLISLKLINRGNMPVKPGDFDQKDPLYLSVQNGELIRADLLDTSESYFKKVFAESAINNQCIQFPPFIMEPGHFIAFRLLILHNESTQPVVQLAGKIANVPAIPVLEPTAHVTAPTKGIMAFEGDVVIQFIRVAVYGLGTLIVLAGILAVFMFIRDRIEINQRRHRRLTTEIRVRKFLETLPGRDRHAIEPIARALIMDDHMPLMFHHELSPLIRHLDRPIDELRKDPHLDMLLADLSMRLPNFRKDYFLSSDSRLKNFVQLLEIVRDMRYF